MKIIMYFAIIGIVVIIFSQKSISAQGCSDAGFCSMNSIKDNEKTDSTSDAKNQIKFGLNYGTAQNNVLIFTSYGEYSRNIGKKISTSIKLLYSVHHGDITTTNGLTDFIVSLNYKITGNLKVIGGFKIPFNKSNYEENGNSLPMAYQTSLGTYDVIVGLSQHINLFGITLAIQQPLSENNNTFFWEDFLNNSNYSKFLSTNAYERKGDILLRLSYYTKFRNDKFVFIPSLLPIYHLGNDTYINKSGVSTKINGSQGLTLNLNTLLQYKMSKTSYVELSLGAPVIARKIRPDGLSQFAIGIEYVVNF
jgi:hypothetical protein